MNDAVIQVIAYLCATKGGNPIWSEACVCQDAIWPMVDDWDNEDDEVSMPMVRQSDVLVVIAAKDAEIAALKARLEIDPTFGYDGIDCRDVTIKAQEDRIISQSSRIAEQDELIAALRTDHAACAAELRRVYETK